MARRTLDPGTVRQNHPLTTELGLVVVAAAAFALWPHVASVVSRPVLDSSAVPNSLLVEGVVAGSVLLAGLCLFTGAYAAFRDIDVGIDLPSSEERRLAGLALVLPAALVALTKSVGALTGVAYGSLTGTYVAADPSLEPYLAVTGLGLFVGVPSLLLLCHVVVQGGFEKALGGDAAVVVTTATAGFLLTSDVGNLSAFPDRGKLAGAALFVLAVAVAAYGIERARRGWVSVLAILPAVLLVGITAVSAIAAVESVAGALFGLAQVAVLGLAAYAYERTDTLVVPALAYASFYLAGNAVVFVFEAGVHG